MQMDLNMHYIVFYLICSLAVFGFYCRWRRFPAHGNTSEERQDVRMLCLFLLIGLAVFLHPCIAHGMKISYTNMNYATPPFSQLGVKTAGPHLSDVTDQNLPHLWRLFVQHTFALWNKDVAFGTQADYSFALYPLNWLYLLGLEAGQLLKTVLEYAIAFLGLFLFLRKCRLSAISAFIGAVSYCFCSVMVMWNGWPHSDVMAFGPWLFYFAEALLLDWHDKKRLRVGSCIGFTAVLYLMLVCGMPTYVPFFLYSGFAYVVLRVVQLFSLPAQWRKGLTLLLVLMACIVVAGLMSFVYTGSVLFGTAEYQEERMPQAFATLEIDYFRTLFFPYYRDGLARHPNECTLYVGPVAAFCLPALLARPAKKEERRGAMVFWAWVAVASLLVIFVHATGYFYRLLPGLNSSLKFRAIALFCFSASLLSAYTVEALSHLSGKRRQWIAVTLVAVTPILVWLAYGYTAELKEYYFLLAIVAVLLAATILRKERAWRYGLCLVCAVCMAVFARQYTPMIDRDAPVIPPETESITYLKQNLKDGERILSLDVWNLFPHSNIYYDIPQIRAHSFVNTNQDMRDYLTAIDPAAYKSPTFTLFRTIEHPSLLSYGSVRYLLAYEANLSAVDELIGQADTSRSPYFYYGDTVLEQHFTTQAGALHGVTFLLSTARHQLSSGDVLDLSLVRVSDGEVVARSAINLSTVRDNAMHSTTWDKAVPCAQGEEFCIRLSSHHLFQDPLAFWKTEAGIYDGDLYVNGVAQVGDLCQLPAYHKTFSDGEYIEELEAYAPRAYFADTVRHQASYAAVLEEMKTQFYPNTAIITDDDWDKLSLDLGDTAQQATIENYRFDGDCIQMDLHTDAGGMVVITDYYSPEWRALVNGKEATVIKTNYLFMGVPIPEAGTYHVAFRYVPTSLYVYAAISGVGFALLAAAILFRRRLEMWIDRRMGTEK